MTLAETSRPTWPQYSVDLGKDMERMAQIDQKAAQESLCRYCKPVELYNIIQRRAMVQPNFLQRCLAYKIQAARERRIKMRIKPVGPPEVFEQGLSIAVMVANAVPSPEIDTFRLSHTRFLTDQGEVIFLLPEIRKLCLYSTKNDHFIVFMVLENFNGNQQALSAGYKKPVYWGKLALSAVCRAWLEQASTAVGFRANIQCSVNFQEGNAQHMDLIDGQVVKFSSLSNGTTLPNIPSLRLQILGEEAGQSAKFTNFSNIQTANGSCVQIDSDVKSRHGRVVFHYLYFYNKLRKMEVTEGFSCPFCLVSGGSFVGLRCHLNSCHDLFKFDYLDTEELQAVVVSCRNDIPDAQRDTSDPRLKSFIYWSNSGPLRKRRSKSTSKQTSDSPVAEARLMNGITCRSRRTHDYSTGSVKDSTCTNILGAGLQHQLGLLDGFCSQRSADGDAPDDDMAQQTEETVSVVSTFQQEPSGRKDLNKRFSLPQLKKRRAEATHDEARLQKGSGSVIRAAISRNRSSLLPPSSKRQKCPAQRFKRCQKVSNERTEARNRQLLQKRQFFHSHTAQPMAWEQLLSDKDSEDELDDTISSLEDRRMLDDFVDVRQYEKELMHRWNIFVRRQKIIADGHCPWAVGAFARIHAEELKPPNMRRSFMLMLVKFWNHHLIDGSVVDQCLSIVDNSSSNNDDRKDNNDNKNEVQVS